MVYVLNENGQPLMPTERYGRVRHLLQSGNAVVVRRCPFTIQLKYHTEDIVQSADLGVDAGSKHIGLSACTDKKELFAAEIELRTDISDNLTQKRTLRRSRRNRKTRYRKPRFQNRTHSKKEGWLAPSVKAKCDCHVTVIQKVCSILPVRSITIEMAPFDTQKLKAQISGKPVPTGTDYQHGESEGYDNIKAYVKWRDAYKCRICGKEHVHLQVHHRVQRKNNGSDMPANLITVCEDCHKAFHAGLLKGKKAKLMLPGPEIKSLRDASFMGIMRWAVWDRLKESGIPLHMTFGYITARRRERFHVEKSHHDDARCISGHGNVPASGEWFAIKKVRCHNRQIHKLTILPGGIRKRNQAPYLVKGFRLFDKVKYRGQECFVTGRRTSGYFVLKTLNRNTVSNSAKASELKLIQPRQYYLTERRVA